jgi:drug/metabolite transporter (DMT)-like permease
MPNALGPVAAFGASVTWAYSTARYARVSRDVGSARVNFARVLVALPVFGIAQLLLRGPRVQDGVTGARAAWLLVSVVSSYALADSVFLTAARRVGVTTALSIASTYPLWAALWGMLLAGEPLGWQRASGTCLAVGGVVWLVQLASARGDGTKAVVQRDRVGLMLALATSLLWAANSISVKRGSEGLSILQVNSIRYAMALALLSPQALRKPAPGLTAAPSGGWLPVLPAILADAVLGSTCYVYGLSHTDLAVGATLSSLAPLLSVPVAVVLGEERWNARRFAAVLLTVGGVIVLVSSRGS